jgi:transposase
MERRNRDRVEFLLETNTFTVAAIAGLAGVSPRTVLNVKNRIKKKKSMARKRPPKSFRKLGPKARRTISALASNSSGTPLREMRNYLAANQGVVIHQSTIWRYLKWRDWYKGVPRTIPVLTPAQIKKRLDFCKKNRKAPWKKWVFSDESCFEFNPRSNRRWMKKKKRRVIKRPKYTVKVHVWGWHSGTAKGDLVFLTQTVRTQSYLDTIEPAITQMKADHPRGFIFQQDGAPAHTARRTMATLAASGVKVAVWPPNSPDLSPIENIWGNMKLRLAAKTWPTVAKFRAEIQRLWDEVPVSHLQSLARSMPKRVVQCLERNGAKVDY